MFSISIATNSELRKVSWQYGLGISIFIWWLPNILLVIMEVKVLSTSTIILVHKTQSKSSFYDRKNCQQSATTTIIEAKLRDQERKDTASHKNEMEDFFFFFSKYSTNISVHSCTCPKKKISVLSCRLDPQYAAVQIRHAMVNLILEVNWISNLNELNKKQLLRPFTSNSSCKLDVLWHYSHPLGMDGTEICILKQTNKVGLCCLLKCKNCMALEPQIRLNKKK